MTATDDRLGALLTRAAGEQRLPDGFASRVVTRARRRRRGTTLGVAAAVAGVLVAGVPFTRTALTTAPPAAAVSTAAASTAASGTAAAASTVPVRRDPALLEVLSSTSGRRIGDGDVLVLAAVGPRTVAVVRRDATATDASLGLRAADVWSVTADGRAFRLTDYVAWGSGCLSGDRVCAGLARGEVGLVVVVVRDGVSHVMVGATGDRPVTVRTAEGQAQTFVPGAAGGAVTVRTSRPGEVVVQPRLADGRSYTIALQPGAVVEDS